MEKNPDNQRLLRRAELLLEEGQSNEALSVLEKIHPATEAEEDELAYLLGWCYLQQKRWSETIQVLSRFGKSEDKVGEENYSRHERHALSLLRLGDAAVRLGRYQDAARCYRSCLQILREKRLALHSEQLQACYSLAAMYAMMGLYRQALDCYEEALALCQDETDDEARANIYFGLCYTYRLVGQPFDALENGKAALEIYVKMGNRPLEAQMRNVLGRIYYLLREYKEAANCYTEALTIDQSPEMVMVNSAALADVSLAEERLEEAKRYCFRAQEIADTLADRADTHRICGLTYFVRGKVVQAEALQAQGEERQELLNEVVEWFKKAQDHLSLTDDHFDTGEVCLRLAQVLEELGRGREALIFWKSAYEVEARVKHQIL